MARYQWGWCDAEDRPHQLVDFTSRQRVDYQGNMYNVTVCRICGKRPNDDD